MRLKYALTIADPKSAQIVAYQARSTGTSHLTKVDVMTALGMTQARHRGGLCLLYAKYTKDADAGRTALRELTKYAQTQARKYVGKIPGRRGAVAVRTLAMLVLEEYCRTADTPGAKCRCGGSGEVCDRKATERSGKLVIVECKKCHGTGLKPITQTRAHHAILALVPGVSRATWYRVDGYNYIANVGTKRGLTPREFGGLLDALGKTCKRFYDNGVLGTGSYTDRDDGLEKVARFGFIIRSKPEDVLKLTSAQRKKRVYPPADILVILSRAGHVAEINITVE